MTEHEREEVRRELGERLEKVSTRQRIQWRLGRRGAFLAVMGCLYIILAFSYGGADLPPFTYKQLQMQVSVFAWVGVEDPQNAMQIWGALWALAGLTAIITSWWPPGRDGIGFNALIAFSLTWATLAYLGDLVLDAPRAFVIGLLFTVYAITIFIASGMIDPGPISKVATEDES